MLDIKFIRESPEKVKEALEKRNMSFDVDYLLEVDEKRRGKIQEVEEMRKQHNEMSERIPGMQGDEKKSLIESSKTLKIKIGDADFELKALEEEFISLMFKIPNIPEPWVIVGKDDTENKVLREVGNKTSFDFKPRDYIEIGDMLDLVDTERATKVSGARFGYLKNEAALMEFALVRFAMDFVGNVKNIQKIIDDKKLELTATSFIPVVPPVLIKPESMRAMGYLDRGEDEIYHLDKDNLYLVGTSEQSVGPMYMNEVFDEKNLPHRHIAFSTCFRREAGSYGKDTRGILRVHQFDKAEMFAFVLPETSRREHQLLLGIEEALMQGMGVPYHVLDICTGDLGDSAAAKYDLEAWLPGQKDGAGEYRETHSTSNTTDFQSRRLNIKVRRKDGTLEFLHMLNGTAFAIGRTLIAILENYQQEDGSVCVPEVLQEYMGGIKEIRR